jgi:hypothetical protein
MVPEEVTSDPYGSMSLLKSYGKIGPRHAYIYYRFRLSLDSGKNRNRACEMRDRLI